MCQLIVGLPAVTILGVVDLVASMPLVIHVETTIAGRDRCGGCGGAGRVKDRDRVM